VAQVAHSDARDEIQDAATVGTVQKGAFGAVDFQRQREVRGLRVVAQKQFL
jgi:hypothetical protein